jgi:sulfur relay (sulfurtransferase) DsrC/TusE family protein
MAFDKNNKNISEMLKATEEKETKQEVVKVVEDFERTKQFQFTLQPSVREKIALLAKENGYRSASSFLNDYFKNL